MPENNGQLDRGRFEGEVLARLAAIDDKLFRLADGNSQLELRTRALENWKWWVTGIAASTGVLSGVIAKKFM